MYLTRQFSRLRYTSQLYQNQKRLERRQDATVKIQPDMTISQLLDKMRKSDIEISAFQSKYFPNAYSSKDKIQYSQKLNLDQAAVIARSQEYTPIYEGIEYQHLEMDVEDTAKGFRDYKSIELKQLKTTDGDYRRDPAIVICGHVDHGKTSILDRIRNTDVQSTEAGGITQHVSAFTVPVQDGNVVFLDTPGHAAFMDMRQRGVFNADMYNFSLSSH